MLVRFSSIETESIIMFGNDAVRLIRMLGASGTVPGAIGAEDIPAAVARLRQSLETLADPVAEDSATVGNGEKEEEAPPPGLAVRAGPLIDLLERAGAAHAPLMWESG